MAVTMAIKDISLVLVTGRSPFTPSLPSPAAGADR
jgi:hypothetical protein